MEVMTTNNTGTRVLAWSATWEQVLPSQFIFRVWELPSQSGWQEH